MVTEVRNNQKFTYEKEQNESHYSDVTLNFINLQIYWKLKYTGNRQSQIF
jgi:hypothetical protein